MSASIIDGKQIAKKVRDQVAVDVAKMKEEHDYVPGLATVLVGEDPASATYVRSKQRMCEKLGIRSVGHNLPAGRISRRCTIVGCAAQCRSRSEWHFSSASFAKTH